MDIVYQEPKSLCARIADGRYVYDDKVLNWINHSCDPNAKLNIAKGSPSLIAIRDILADEEITVDYNQTEVQGVKLECTCKSGSCRGEFNQL